MLLRAAEIADLAEIMALERLPQFRLQVGQWPEAKHRRVFDETESRYFIAATAADPYSGFAILRGAGAPDGSVLLQRIVVRRPGEGVGSAMLRRLLQIVFHEYGAHRLWLDVFEDNLKAQRLYERFGFCVEGRLREAAYRDGRYFNMLIMALLDREHTAKCDCDKP